MLFLDFVALKKTKTAELPDCLIHQKTEEQFNQIFIHHPMNSACQSTKFQSTTKVSAT